MAFGFYFLFLCLLTWLISLNLDSFFDWPFKEFPRLTLAALLMLFVAFTVRPKEGIPAYRVRLPFVVVAIVLLGIAAVRLPVLFPLSTRIRGEAFHEAPLATVLQFVSEQRQERPQWRFEVCDEQAAREPVSITLPEDCTLEEALNAISRRIDCAYTWHWGGRGFGVGPPLCASIKFYRNGTTYDPSSKSALFVQGKTIYLTSDANEIAH